MKRIYLANPFGFSSTANAHILPILVSNLESLGFEVWEPFARNGQVDFAKKNWAYHIGQKDFQDVKDCDAIFAVVNGNPPDEGVMIELGMCIALGKPTFLYRDDFRKCTDSDQYPLNLMLFTGLPEENWEEYYFTSPDGILSNSKALEKFAKG